MVVESPERNNTGKMDTRGCIFDSGFDNLHLYSFTANPGARPKLYDFYICFIKWRSSICSKDEELNIFYSGGTNMCDFIEGQTKHN